MRSPSNVLLADKLREMADILEVQHEDGYRVAAYRRASRTLVELEKPIDEIVRDEGLKGVIALPGIGRGELSRVPRRLFRLSQAASAAGSSRLA